MTEQIGQSIMRTARFTADGVAFSPDPAPTCTVRNLATGTEIVTDAATVLTDDYYVYTLASGLNTAQADLEFEFSTEDTDADAGEMYAYAEVRSWTTRAATPDDLPPDPLDADATQAAALAALQEYDATTPADIPTPLNSGQTQAAAAAALTAYGAAKVSDLPTPLNSGQTQAAAAAALTAYGTAKTSELPDDPLTAEQTQQAAQDALETLGYTEARAEYLDVLSGLVAALAAAVWGYSTRTLTSFGSVASDVWNALRASHTTPNSFGAALSSILSTLIGIGSSQIALTAPAVQEHDRITFYTGDSYTAASDRPLPTWRYEDEWIDLTGSDVVLEISTTAKTPQIVLELDAEIVSVTNPVIVQAQLTIEDTETLSARGKSAYQYRLYIQRGDDVKVTLSTGFVDIR